MKKIFTSTLVLVLITLIAGFALATVYEVTKEPIAAAEQKAKEDAYRMVMPNASAFVAIGSLEHEHYPLHRDGMLINECLTAMDQDGNFLGYVINVTSPNGYGGDITIAVGILKDQTIQGISIIAQSETAGLGATCADDKFTNQFSGIPGYVGFENTDLPEENRIDAISGATITTKAVTEAVNAAVSFADEQIHAEGGKD